MNPNSNTDQYLAPTSHRKAIFTVPRVHLLLCCK